MCKPYMCIFFFSMYLQNVWGLFYLSSWVIENWLKVWKLVIAVGCVYWKCSNISKSSFDVTLLFLPPLFSLVSTGHIQTIDSFVSDSLEILSNRPESMEEVGEAKRKYNQILARKSQVSSTNTKHGCLFQVKDAFT